MTAYGEYAIIRHIKIDRKKDGRDDTPTVQTKVRTKKNKTQGGTVKNKKALRLFGAALKTTRRQTMTITNELIYTVQNAKSPEEFVKIAKDNDAIISIENAKMLFMAIQAAHKNKAKHTA